MKDEFTLKINENLKTMVSFPIREKKDILQILFETIRYYLISDIKNEALDNIKKRKVLNSANYGNITIKIDKMSRVIYKLENKIFSFGFPFIISKIEEKYNIYDKNSGITIDSSIVSKIINILNNFSFKNNDIYEFLSQFDDGNNDEEELNKIWQIFKRALFSECGYLRYNYDEEHKNGDIHPLNHYDIYYTNTNTFKIGLDDRVDLEKFIDLLNLNTNCHFFK